MTAIASPLRRRRSTARCSPRASVDAFRTAAPAHGGAEDGTPDPGRDCVHDDASITDPDGYRLEACRTLSV
ncbi:MAG: hypothetical protein SNJ73_09600 [Acetobacteraceae bacterium]